ncbi:L-threonylcarbamoyladenylate synthase [Gammaproteobacteria bacterium]|nr:L-threonylcarbamoyladenylate synthase [Gammaproteobacteria bacterium]
MLKKSLNLLSSAKWLAEGKILIHPTEGIWGIGCNALNKESFLRVYDLKKRPKNKSFILLIDSLDTISKYINKLSDKELNFIDTVWPGPTTLLINYDEKLPDHLQNASGKIAVRVSNHYPIKSLLSVFNGIMVSTSANISGQNNLNYIDEILSVFNEPDVAYFDDKLGNNNKPSKIIDLHTRVVIRD